MAKFAAECLGCILDKGSIDSTDMVRLRGLSVRLGLSSKEIAASKIDITEIFYFCSS